MFSISFLMVVTSTLDDGGKMVNLWILGNILSPRIDKTWPPKPLSLIVVMISTHKIRDGSGMTKSIVEVGVGVGNVGMSIYRIILWSPIDLEVFVSISTERNDRVGLAKSMESGHGRWSSSNRSSDRIRVKVIHIRHGSVMLYHGMGVGRGRRPTLTKLFDIVAVTITIEVLRDLVDRERSGLSSGWLGIMSVGPWRPRIGRLGRVGRVLFGWGDWWRLVSREWLRVGIKSGLHCWALVPNVKESARKEGKEGSREGREMRRKGYLGLTYLVMDWSYWTRCWWCGLWLGNQHATWMARGKIGKSGAEEEERREEKGRRKRRRGKGRRKRNEMYSPTLQAWSQISGEQRRIKV
jgi:hypothetical protein